MKNDINKVFLEKYKELEITAREYLQTDSPIMELGLILSEIDKNKLNITRQMRNFISHNPCNYVTANEEMISFLDEMILLVKRTNGTLKDFKLTIKKSPIVSDTDSITDCIDKVMKFNFVYVIDKDNKVIGYIDKNKVLQTFKEKNRSVKVKSFYTEANPTTLSIYEEDTPISDVVLCKNSCVVTKKGKVVGTYVE